MTIEYLKSVMDDLNRTACIVFVKNSFKLPETAFQTFVGNNIPILDDGENIKVGYLQPGVQCIASTKHKLAENEIELSFIGYTAIVHSEDDIFDIFDQYLS